jgi:L-aminopeptidase/D-esterase-like protein
VNAAGTVTVAGSKYFWAAPFELDGEFGGFGFPHPVPQLPAILALKGSPGQNTTLAIVATGLALTRPQAKRLATMAAAGLARAIIPVFTPLDGDIVFAVSTNRMPLADPVYGLAEAGYAASLCLARAVARAVFEAKGPLPDGTRSYGDLSGTGA